MKNTEQKHISNISLKAAHLLFSCIFIFSVNFSNAQNFGDKAHYLIDSVNLSTLGESDILLLDSLLIEYHGTSDSIEKINCLMYFTENAINFKIAELFNKHIISTIEQKIVAGFSSDSIKYEFLSRLGESYSTQAYFEQGNGYYTKAVKSCNQAKKYQLLINDEPNLAITYNNLGGVFFNVKQYDSALFHFTAAYRLQEKNNDIPKNVTVTIGNIAVCLQKIGNKVEATLNLQKLIKLCKDTGDKYCIGKSYHNMANMLADARDYPKKEKYLKIANENFHSIKNYKWLSFNYTAQAELQQKMGNTDLAITAAHKGQEYARELNFIQPLMKSSELLYKLYKEKGKFDSALMYHELYQSLSDSLSGVDFNLELTQKEMVFEFEQMQLKLQNELDRKLELAQIKENQRRIVNNSILILLFVVLLFALIFYYRMRVTASQNKVIEKQNDEKKLLLKEIHHRVKNNFQIVISILRLQANQEDNEQVQQSFQDAVNRIHSMSTVHELIYKNENFVEIHPKEYFLSLTNSMRTYTANDNINFIVKSEIEDLDIETLIPLGIAVNELITNSIKYAFDDSIESPTIEISLALENGEKMLKYSDNGIGIDVNKLTDTFGIELIETIIEKIDGVLMAENSDQGVLVKFSFK